MKQNKQVYIFLRSAIYFLFRLSGWYLGGWVVILIGAFITNSNKLIINNLWLSIPAFMFFPLYYANKWFNIH
jgi:hypothetical protein